MRWPPSKPGHGDRLRPRRRRPTQACHRHLKRRPEPLLRLYHAVFRMDRIGDLTAHLPTSRRRSSAGRAISMWPPAASPRRARLLTLAAASARLAWQSLSSSRCCQPRRSSRVSWPPARAEGAGLQPRALAPPLGAHVRRGAWPCRTSRPPRASTRCPRSRPSRCSSIVRGPPMPTSRSHRRTPRPSPRFASARRFALRSSWRQRGPMCCRRAKAAGTA